MNSQARIEHHHDLQQSRAEVYAEEIVGCIPDEIPTEQFDRGAEILASRLSSRSNQARPRSAS